MNNTNYYAQQSQVQQPPPQQQQSASSLHGFPPGQMSVQQMQEMQSKILAQDYGRKQHPSQQLQQQPHQLNPQHPQSFGMAHSAANPSALNGPSSSSRPGSVGPGAVVNGVVNGHIGHPQGGAFDHHQFAAPGHMQLGQPGTHSQHAPQAGHHEHQPQMGGYQQQYSSRTGHPPGAPMMNGNVSIPQRTPHSHPSPLQSTQTQNIAQIRRGVSMNMSTGTVQPIANRAASSNIPASDFGVQQHNAGLSYNTSTRGLQGVNQGGGAPGVNGGVNHLQMGGQTQNPNVPPSQMSMQMRTNTTVVANGIPMQHQHQHPRSSTRAPSQMGPNSALLGGAVGSPRMNGAVPASVPGVPHPMATRASSMGPSYISGPASQSGHSSQPQMGNPAGPSSSTAGPSTGTFAVAPSGAPANMPIDARQHQIQQQMQPIPQASHPAPTQITGKGAAEAEAAKSQRTRPSDAPPNVIAQTLAQINPALKTINQAVTNVRVLPFASDPSDVTHGGELPVLSEKDLLQMKEVTKKDEEYEALWRGTRDRMSQEMEEAVGGTVKWWEKDLAAPDSVEERTRLEIVWPDQSRQLREKRRERKEIRLPRPSRAASRRPEELVPIRIEIEHENHRLRDTFVWNLNDPVVTPEIFAHTTCLDLDLPHYFISQFGSQLKQQLSEYSTHKLEYPTPMDIEESKVKIKAPLLAGRLDSMDEEVWSRWRKRLRVSEDGSHSGVRAGHGRENSRNEADLSDSQSVDGSERGTMDDVFDADTSLTSIEDEDEMVGELRILIKLDITVGSINLSDQFEWDISDSNNSPELFAEVYCRDLGLAGDFRTAIAHDIREQIYAYKKCLAVVGYPFDGSSVQDDDLKTVFLPAIKRTARTLEDAETYTPLLNYLSEGEMERLEKEREKEIRRKKRPGRGRAKALSDRDPVKTQRTLLGATEIHNGMPPPAVVPMGGTVRRAAAQAASATIASLAASENSDRPYGVMMTPPIVHERPQPVQPVAPPPPAKPTKRQKSIQLRAPTLPDDIFHPRSRLSITRSVATTPVKPSSSRAPTAKEVADAKIKEYAEGLHPCIVNGKWHCSVCGCPEDIAIGRRKGPLGEKTMCGDCGKFYHRHRRPNDQVEYNTDPIYHLTKRRSNEELRRIQRRGMGYRASHMAPIPLPDASNSRGDSPLSDDDDDDDDDDVPLASRRSKQPSVNRIQSPDLSDLDSNAGDSKPLIQVTAQAKDAKASAAPERLLSPPAEVKPMSQPEQTPTASPAMNRSWPNGANTSPVPPQSSPAVPSPRVPRRLPQALRDPYFLRMLLSGCNDRPLQPGADPAAPPEWRLKCFDCPGKLYTPGPNETLDNFIVHLKNRNHRNNVFKRQNEAKQSTTPTPTTTTITNAATS
ncbi:uncharacterized protein EI90DRAFT_3119709 [Cantharellus anzutake]|uniref:uncharacterized protein n=1 Tax=Cantharellus anzutake TaxID=1750568 RepID=UPI00190575CD|nr:uncharacterized protein EI90DRAFT_3119709 [Cantharellus anzutake]KAF8336441.1 hypothetical protein EI90DRAFT_3119709 [Cantharellus anzutake]